jgi:DNA-binding protein HU-beta
MTKAEIVTKISNDLGIEKTDVLATIESFMSEVKGSLESGNNVYLRGFGSFVVKTRA